MLSLMDATPRRIRRQPRLIFAPLAWLKLQFFCHAGDTEIAGFAITAKENPLYVEEFVTVRQATSAVTVALDDAAIADYVDSPPRDARVESARGVGRAKRAQRGVTSRISPAGFGDRRRWRGGRSKKRDKGSPSTMRRRSV